MESLEDSVRLELEKQFDEFHKEPEGWEKLIKTFLIDQGIDPNLETTLSMIVGLCLGMAYKMIENKHNRTWTPKEADSISTLLARRSQELRHLFLSTRLNED